MHSEREGEEGMGWRLVSGLSERGSAAGEEVGWSEKLGLAYILQRVIGLHLGQLGLENINRDGPYKWSDSANRTIFGGRLFYNDHLH